jgi:hypothetical protein
VKTREREVRRVGASAAILKTKGKWRQRIFKAKQQLLASEEYDQMSSDIREIVLCRLVTEHKIKRDNEIEDIRKFYVEDTTKYGTHSS